MDKTTQGLPFVFVQMLVVGVVAIASANLSAEEQERERMAVPPAEEPRLYDLINAVSAERIESDIRTLVDFGTRHTLSETENDTRGIGAARRWIYDEFLNISQRCDNCLEVSYQRTTVPGQAGTRIPVDTEIVNVIAILRGTTDPNRYVIMSGDIDNRISDPNNFTDDSPGANDNASGMAGTIEAARVLSQFAGSFSASIVFTGLSGEENGLLGGMHMAAVAREENWLIEAVINNDMIGNVEGIDGVIQNNAFRVFSEPTPVTETDTDRRARRFSGGEVDGVSRQLARYISRITDRYIANLEAKMIYRLDRFGRGGHHRPFNDAGYPAVRIMETHENYRRQHQDVRIEDGVQYGDLIDGVNFKYAAKLTGVNVASLASLAWAPTPPTDVTITGAVQPSTTLSWKRVDAANLAGYRVYWRDTTAPQWMQSRFVGKTTNYTFENLVIDNYFFGVAAVGHDGNESVVVFPSPQR